MKVAYCLSGLARDNAETFEYTKAGILDKWNPDVFVSVWDRDYTGIFNSTHEELIALYNPVAYRVDEHIDLVAPFMEEYPRKDRWRNFEKTYPEVKKYRSSWGRTNVLNMYYQIYNCNELKKQYERIKGFNYDIVIRARADGGWAINAPLSVSENTVFLHNLKDPVLLSDWFAFGDSPSMDKYSAVFPNIQSIAQAQENYETTEATHVQAWYKWLDPHRVLRDHLTREQVNFKIMDRADIRSQGHRGVAEVMKERGL